MKRPALQNKQVALLRMAFPARKVFGTFEKRAPEQDSMPVQCSAAEAQQTAKIKIVSIRRSIEIS